MYNTINIINIVMYVKVVKRVNPKSSHHKEKLSLVLHLHEMMGGH